MPETISSLLAAMITPAVLISGAGTLIMSTSTRVGRATDRVRALCERLSADQREVLLMRLVGRLTVEEVANALGKTEGAVKALQRRGFRAITRMIQREGVPL